MAWVLITAVGSALMPLYLPLRRELLAVIIITVINGGVQMGIDFPIFKIIFPEEQAAQN